jgi:hypothetical protein
LAVRDDHGRRSGNDEIRGEMPGKRASVKNDRSEEGCRAQGRPRLRGEEGS